MKTLKVANGDFYFDETGQLAIVEGDEEIAQAVAMNFSIEKGEFPLDEYIGIDTTFMQDKSSDEEDVTNALIEAVQVLTDNEIIEGLDNINATQNGRTILVTSLNVIKIDEEETIKIEGVEIDGS